MRARHSIPSLALLIVGLASGGCAVGNTHVYHSVLADLRLSGSGRVAVATHDQRPYVVSGEKAPQFVGLSRGGVGNPFDVRTADRAPLADGMTQAISSSLRQKGFEAVPILISHAATAAEIRDKIDRVGAERAILVTLREWRSDTYQNTALSFDVTLSVLNRAGQVVGEKRLQGRDNLGGSPWNPPAHARNAVPVAFKAKLESLLDDADVARALALR